MQEDLDVLQNYVCKKKKKKLTGMWKMHSEDGTENNGTFKESHGREILRIAASCPKDALFGDHSVL